MRNKLATLIAGAVVLALPALAQATPAGPPAPSLITQLLPFIILLPVFYFLLIRPQQQRAKKHTAMISAIKRGDTVIMSGGLIGKVSKVSEDELSLDLTDTVRVRVVKSMVIEVRGKAEPVAAND